jgi:hypothetical protein
VKACIRPRTEGLRENVGRTEVTYKIIEETYIVHILPVVEKAQERQLDNKERFSVPTFQPV